MKTQDVLEREEKIISTNRKAKHEFEILQTFEAGIALKGTEVKSLRMGRCSIQEAYAGFKSPQDDELYIFNMHIKEYEHGGRDNHNPTRVRKLLVHKHEAIRLKTKVNEKGLTIIPLTIYFSGPFVKLEMAVARAKRKYDKREDKKKKDIDKEIRKKFRV